MSVTTVPIRPIKKGSLTKLWIGLAIVLAIAAGLAWAGTQDAVTSGASNEDFLAANASESGVETTESGLQILTITEGSGPSPTITDTALVKYEGRLRDGTVFDANEQAPMPVGGLVPGFSEALMKMQKGGEYRIWIPSDLAYGESSPGEAIPPDSLLIFDVTLIDFINAEQMQAIQAQAMEQQMQQGGPPPGQ